MPRIMREGMWWEHHTGAYAWAEPQPAVVHQREARTANLHVIVPEEHRLKGIGTELLLQAVRDLEADNLTLPPGERFHSAFVNVPTQFESAKQAIAVFKKAGFEEAGGDVANLFLQKMLKNFE